MPTIDDLKIIFEETLKDNEMNEEDYSFEDYLKTCGFKVKED